MVTLVWLIDSLLLYCCQPVSLSPFLLLSLSTSGSPFLPPLCIWFSLCMWFSLSLSLLPSLSLCASGSLSTSGSPCLSPPSLSICQYFLLTSELLRSSVPRQQNLGIKGQQRPRLLLAGQCRPVWKYVHLQSQFGCSTYIILYKRGTVPLLASNLNSSGRNHDGSLFAIEDRGAEKGWFMTYLRL